MQTGLGFVDGGVVVVTVMGLLGVIVVDVFGQGGTENEGRV